MSEFVPRLGLARDVSPAAWLAESTLEMGVGSSFVPGGLDGNEVDASWTCVGGSRALIDELLAHPELEVLELDPALKTSPYSGLTGDGA